nr:reverse transcriptase domain-containing protein [Tanacetum cinerariifolium]
MSEPAELGLTAPTSAVRNIVGKEKQQTSKNTDRPASDAALREYCDKHYHKLLSIIAEKVHNEKVQQEKLKEVKARLKLKGCSRRNSRIQEESQYTESRTPNQRGDLRRRLKPKRSCGMSRSLEPTSFFSRIRRDKSTLPKHRRGDKRIKKGDVLHRIRGRGKSVSSHSESPTRAPVHKEHSRSQKVKIVDGGTGSQGRESRNQASKKKTYINHGHARKQTPSPLETKAVIPAEIGMPTLRTAEIDIVQNDEALEINPDLFEERREQASIREARSKAKMEKYYNFKVHNTSFKPRYLVNRNNDASHAKDSRKLSPKWEGTYEVTKSLGNRAYKLRDRDGKHLS